MPGDLVGGAYPLTFDLRKATGLASNATQTNFGVRTNASWLGLSDATDAAASLVSGDMTLIAVPVEVGDIISTITAIVGNTAASTPTHAWAAVYSGALTTAKIQGAQSTDAATAPIVAHKPLVFTLATTVLVTGGSTGNAPYGYVYVGLGATASTVPSLDGGNMATEVQTGWAATFADAPLVFSGTISEAGATAPTSVTLSSVTAIATVPYVFLA